MKRTKPKLDRRLEIAWWVGVFAAMVLAGRFARSDAESQAGAGDAVRIGYVSWAEGIAMTHLVKVILEERMGYAVQLTLADPAPIFTSLAEGSLDFFLDAWLPLTHRSHMERYRNELNDLGYNYQGARIGLVVPAYLDEVSAIPDLSRHRDLFDGAITGIDSGAGIMEATRRAIDRYNLDLRLVTSSGAAMTAALRDAIQSEEAIVVTGWKPHWMFARWELKFLADPRTVYGEAENIHAIARPGIARDFPDVVAFIKDFRLNDQQIGSLMDAMNQAPTEEQAARDWMKDHADLVEGWLDGGEAAE